MAMPPGAQRRPARKNFGNAAKRRNADRPFAHERNRMRPRAWRGRARLKNGRAVPAANALDTRRHEDHAARERPIARRTPNGAKTTLDETPPAPTRTRPPPPRRYRQPDAASFCAGVKPPRP